MISLSFLKIRNILKSWKTETERWRQRLEVGAVIQFLLEPSRKELDTTERLN